MNKLLTLVVLALSLMGFNSLSYADDGAKPCADGDSACMEQQKKKTKKKAGEEEPECD
jgi:hypothetical protein